MNEIIYENLTTPRKQAIAIRRVSVSYLALKSEYEQFCLEHPKGYHLIKRRTAQHIDSMWSDLYELKNRYPQSYYRVMDRLKIALGNMDMPKI